MRTILREYRLKSSIGEGTPIMLDLHPNEVIINVQRFNETTVTVFTEESEATGAVAELLNTRSEGFAAVGD